MAEPMPATMRAVLLTGFGGYDRLELRDDIPVPRPGPGEVLVRVGAAGINNTDINTRIGWYSKEVSGATDDAGDDGFTAARDDSWSGAAFAFPRIQGADCCGTIVAIGDAVDPNRIGDRVLVDPQVRRTDGPVRYLGSEIDGAFAEYCCVPSVNALHIDSRLSDAELASFPCAYSTAENILTRIGLQQGETVLITGASGGVGSAAVQLARRRGATVIAIAGSGKAEAVKALGAERIVERDADLTLAVGTEQVDAVVDIVGGPQFPQLLTCLKRGGRYGVSGAIAGPMVELDLRTLYLKDLSLVGCTEVEPAIFTNLVRYIEQGEIHPAIDAILPLEDIVTAQKRFLEKSHIGKMVLAISPPAA